MTLRVDLFGDFGYHDLYKQFEAAHPGVTIKEDIESYADHHANLAKHLATGAGADDVVAIEVGFIAQFKSEPQNFVDLNQYGAASLKSQWLPWKWAAVDRSERGADRARHRRRQHGHLLPPRPDAGGRPADEPRRGLEALADLAPIHQEGASSSRRRRRRARTSSTRARNVFNAMVGQLNPAYYDAQGNVIVGSNPRSSRHGT